MNKKDNISFAYEIKNEIINNKMTKDESLSFIHGVIYSLYKNQNNIIKVSIKNKRLFDNFTQLVLKSKIEHIRINDRYEFNKNQLSFIKPKSASWFLAGCFFASGSISKLNSSSYHLQISFKDQNHANKIKDFSSKHIIFNIATNKNVFVLYIKKHEIIGDFLYIVGAHKSYFKFIESVFERDHRNQITRISNLDIHNQGKLVESNQEFINNLNKIKKHRLEYKFTKDQLTFFNFKKQNPYLPLSQIVDEIAKKHNIIKTKGGLNHWLIKLRNICDDIDE